MLVDAESAIVAPVVSEKCTGPAPPSPQSLMARRLQAQRSRKSRGSIHSTSSDDLHLFLSSCARTGRDPTTRQRRFSLGTFLTPRTSPTRAQNVTKGRRYSLDVPTSSESKTRHYSAAEIEPQNKSRARRCSVDGLPKYEANQTSGQRSRRCSVDVLLKNDEQPSIQASRRFSVGALIKSGTSRSSNSPGRRFSVGTFLKSEKKAIQTVSAQDSFQSVDENSAGEFQESHEQYDSIATKMYYSLPTRSHHRLNLHKGHTLLPESMAKVHNQSPTREPDVSSATKKYGSLARASSKKVKNLIPNVLNVKPRQRRITLAKLNYIPPPGNVSCWSEDCENIIQENISPMEELYLENTSPFMKEYMDKVKQLCATLPTEDDPCYCAYHVATEEVGRASTDTALGETNEAFDCCTVAMEEGEAVGNQCSQCDAKEQEPTEKERRSLKVNTVEDIKKLKRDVVFDVFRSVLRNLSCYLALALLVLVAIEAPMSMELTEWQEAVPLIILCLTLAGIPFQVIHVIREINSPNRRTVIGQMLANRTNHFSDFIRMMEQRRLAAPYITMEIRIRNSLKARVAYFTQNNDPDDIESNHHWSTVTKRMNKMLVYTDWHDGSTEPSSSLSEVSEKVNWMIVAKDYCCMNQKTELSIREDVLDFCRDSELDTSNQKVTMKSQFVLDVVEGEPYPDMEAFLVCPDECKSCLYTFNLYKIMMCLCLDSIYNILFHVCTRFAGLYTIVKLLER